MYCGFRPEFVLIKRTDATSPVGLGWIILDGTRSPTNVTGSMEYLIANEASAEATTLDMDRLANGFKLRNAFANQNASGGTYIFAAYAENPFQGGTADSRSQGRAR